ncbi:MAG: hypothetical protein ABSA26_00595 [Thermoguttaceae bacterium]|jgi:hypothetical protein
MSVNLVKQWFPQFLTALDRAPMAGLLCAAAILFGVTLAWTRSAAMPDSAKGAFEASMLNQAYGSGEKSQGNEKVVGLHEGGEIINQAGYFHAAGNRVAFVSADNKRSFITLENRSLERIARAITENAKELEWIVSGTISEYRGANFLLISRAELKSRVLSSDAAE